jgi:hypothetical protein
MNKPTLNQNNYEHNTNINANHAKHQIVSNILTLTIYGKLEINLSIETQ